VYRLLHLSLIGAVLLSPALAPAVEAAGLSQVVIPGAPNPVLTKSMSPSPPIVGQAARISVVATNAGPVEAQNVVITDPLPDNIALVAVSSTQGNITVQHQIITVYVGTLPPGQSVTVTSDVVVVGEFARNTPYTNCAGLTFRDGTVRMACFPLGPAYSPVSVASPPPFLPEAGAEAWPAPIGLFVAGLACLLAAHHLRRRAYR
jgi:uncharacterized repeat protein (TIGR01451 family)